MGTDPRSNTFEVGSSSFRGRLTEPVAQLNAAESGETFADLEPERDFVVVRNPDAIAADGRTDSVAVHTRTQAVDHVRAEEVGLDFNLRFALGAVAKGDLPYGDATSSDVVEVEPTGNPETSTGRRYLNRLFGTRVQVCRVKMAVQPDLENHICRLSRGTMDVLEIESGDKVCIEYPSEDPETGIVRGVKVFPIEREIAEKKNRQEDLLPERYPSCEDLLGLNRIRETEIDVTTIYLDAAIRKELGIDDKVRNGVCQPVRVYRDNRHVLVNTLHDFTLPLAIGIVGAAIGVDGSLAKAVLFGTAFVLIVLRSLLERVLVVH